CPQPCITGTVAPSNSPVLVDAYSTPVFSSIGKASVSARKATVAPSPLRSMATTPVPPHRKCSMPISSSSFSINSCVLYSFLDSSCFCCRCRYVATISSCAQVLKSILIINPTVLVFLQLEYRMDRFQPLFQQKFICAPSLPLTLPIPP